MKVNTNQSLKDLEGEDIKDTSVGKTIARILVGEKSSDPLRSYSLAMEFYKKDEVELNAADLKFVTEALKSTAMFTPLATGQILELLK